MGGDGGVAWVILDASRAPRKATALVPLDHFSSHTIEIPSPAIEWSGQAAFTERDVSGSNIPLVVPTGLFANGVWDRVALDNPGTRRGLYVAELKELARQTTPRRSKLWKGYDEVWSKVTEGLNRSQSFAEFAKGVSNVGASYKLQASLVTHSAAEAKRLLELSQGLLTLADNLGSFATILDKAGNGLDYVGCFTNGVLQTYVLLTLDDQLVGARWTAMKKMLLASPLGLGDASLRGAIDDVDLVIGNAAPEFLKNTLSALDKVIGGAAVPACTDLAVSIVSGVVAEALAAAVFGVGAPAVITAAVATKLMGDWITKDTFLAAQNAEQLAILGSLLQKGDLGSFPELRSSWVVDGKGLFTMRVPDVLDPLAPTSEPYLRLSVAAYAQSSIYTTLATVVRREDISDVSKFFKGWVDGWCAVSKSCPSGWGMEMLGTFMDQVAFANDMARDDLVQSFAACGVAGACDATCDDGDKDGYGVGLLCAGSDCAPTDPTRNSVCDGPCTTETNPAFCSRLGFNCGYVSANDNCGLGRSVNCALASGSEAASQSCGTCMAQTRTCTNNTWGDWGACSGQGTCAPNATQNCGSGGTQTCDNNCTWGACSGQPCSGDTSQTCGNCGTQTRTCVNGAWETWGTCTGEHGVCASGATQSCTDGTQICTSACDWGPCAGMVSVPGGTVTLGSNVSNDSNPSHSSTVATFLMDLTEVTVSAYASCVTAPQCATPTTGSLYTWGVTGKENHPINGVSWTDANTYCTWAGKRLPTEEEWEYAARYDDGRDYPWGSTAPSATLANYGTSGTTAVGSYPSGASKLGMQDLAGNVWEWTSTWYCSTPPCTGTSGTYRVLRGGSWGGLTSSLRAASRNGSSPSNRYYSFGFRCARTP
jgi:formylglycine-generating enzyme required for sulfatase activity